MTWSYRIVKDSKGYSLKEVFYEDGLPTSCTEDAIDFSVDLEEGPEGIIKSLEMALEDAQKYPVLIDTGEGFKVA